MPILDLEVKIMDLCDCMIASLVNAAIYFKHDYEYMFKPLWVFQYQSSQNANEPFWKRLNLPLNENPQDLMSIHHGVHLDYIKGMPYETFLQDIQKQIAVGKPVVMEFDAFHCPWAGVYQKAFLLHYSIVIGYSDDHNILYCADPYVTNKVVEISVDELKKGYRHHYIFEIIEPVKDTENWKDDIRSYIISKKVCEGNVSQNAMIRLLARDISTSDAFLVEMKKQNDYYTYELFYQMKYMTHSRLNYGMFLKYIMECENIVELKPIIQKFNEASDIWRQIWLRFTKLAYLENLNKAPAIVQNIVDNLMNVADLEEETVDALLVITK